MSLRRHYATRREEDLFSLARPSSLASCYALFRGISWLSAHPKYAHISYILAEYAAKAAICACLPPCKAKKCRRMLQTFGFDVESIGMDTVGKSVFDLVLPGGAQTATQYSSSAGAAASPEPPANVIIEGLLRKLRELASLPSSLGGAHGKFAHAIKERLAVPQGESARDILRKAGSDAYGRAHQYWLELGLPILFSSFASVQDGLHWLRTSGEHEIEQRLSRSYEQLRQFARRIQPEIDRLGHEALDYLRFLDHHHHDSQHAKKRAAAEAAQKTHSDQASQRLFKTDHRPAANK